MLFGRSKNLVGLDIGDSSIKVVQLKDLGRGKGLQVDKLGWEPLSAEAIVDGAIMDSHLVIETIQRLFERCRIKSSAPVATALSGHSVIIKRISLPVMNAAELAESIHWERSSTSRSISRMSTWTTRSSRAPASPAKATWTCCSPRRRRKRSTTTSAS